LGNSYRISEVTCKISHINNPKYNEKYIKMHGKEGEYSTVDWLRVNSGVSFARKYG
jgi:hypothetical protein